MSATKTFTIKSVGFGSDASGTVLLVTLVNPPQTLNGMTLFVAEEPHVVEVPTTTESLIADLAAYAAGNTITATYPAPVAPAKTAAATVTAA